MSKKILIIEDEEALLDIYVTLLKEEGFEVDGARDGQEGLDKMLTGGYDLVLLDIIMPRLNGRDVLTKYKESAPKLPNKKIVPLTNLVHFLGSIPRRSASSQQGIPRQARDDAL
jgi:DNA-binding response OmpR family regulator